MRKRKEGCFDWPSVNLTNWVNNTKRMGKGQYVIQFFGGNFYAPGRAGGSLRVYGVAGGGV